MRPVAVTPYPTGVVCGQMTVENLLQAGERLGYDVDIEVQGAVGTRDGLASDATAEADAVIITPDTSVSRDRFDGKLIFKRAIKDGVNNAEAVVQKAIEFVEAGKIGSITFGSGNDGEGVNVGVGNSPDGADAVESGESVHHGGDPEKGLFTRSRKLFS